MLHRLVEHHGQRGGHADTAVGAQRRTFGPDPLAVDTRADGIVVEVELHIGVLFADHVHVRLEDHGCALLHARRGGLAHHDVADGVLFIFDMVLLAKSTRKSMILPSFFEGRGTRVMASNCSQTRRGSKEVISDIDFCIFAKLGKIRNFDNIKYGNEWISE